MRKISQTTKKPNVSMIYSLVEQLPYIFSKVKKKKQADRFLSYKAPGFAPEETSTFLVIVNQPPKDGSSNITKDSDDDNVIIAFRGKEVRGVRKTAEVGNSVIDRKSVV